MLFGEAVWGATEGWSGGWAGSLAVRRHLIFHHLLRPTRPDAQGVRLADHFGVRETGDLGPACEGDDPAGIERQCFLRLELDRPKSTSSCKRP